jgi:predicted Ser/Thr protein kinase
MISEAELAPGTRVADRYTIEQRLSQGAAGAVYRARDDDGELVALKRLLDPAMAVRMEIEARLLSRLRHPRVVRTLGHLDDEAGPFIVMELVRGRDLADALIEHGGTGLALDDALRCASEACEALAYVHSEGIVHRDVKPHNLVRGEEGVVLVDFGIAREEAEDASATRGIGSPRYMAPEILVGEGVSPRSDVYSLAATVWALLTGTPPSYREPERLTDRVPGLGEEIERTLRQALDLRPERRIASVEAFAAALGSPLGASSGESLAASVAAPAVRRGLLETLVRTAAGVFEASAASLALADPVTGELVFNAAWGAGADEIVGVRLPRGAGIAGAVAEHGVGEAIPDCRNDERWAATIARNTGYVPHTMLVAPLRGEAGTIGVLSLLDRRSGEPYAVEDLARADLFADLAVAAL